MSEIREIVNSLEDRFQKLFNKMESMQRANQELLLKLGESEKVIQKQQQEITSLKTNFDSIKITNSLLGSDEYKRDTKLKINSLIREIDYCIAQLSD
jgi:chromosome segregation ATPase